MTDGFQVDMTGGVARLRFNRPAKRNALTGEMTQALLDTVRQIAPNDQVRLVVLEAEGADFCAGADMARVEAASSSAPPPGRSLLDAVIHPLIEAIDALPQPVLTSVRGNAIGIGAQLVLMADLAVAAESLVLRFPQAVLGHNLDHGESWFLPQRLSMQLAMELALTGGKLTAQQAGQAGLLNRVVADSDLAAETDRMIAAVMGAAPAAVLHNKSLLKASRSRTLAEALKDERTRFGQSILTSDFREAMTAFREKRPPRFTGR